MPFVKPQDALLWYTARGGTDAPVQTRTTAQYVIPAGREQHDLNHFFQTTSVVPAFTPSWNTVVSPIRIDLTKLFVKFSVTAPDRNAMVDFSVTRGSAETVSADSESYVINHNLGDADAVILVSTSWNTAIGRTSKTANALTIAFSNPPSGAGTIYWSRHSESDDITGSDDTVSANAETHTITHNAGQAHLPCFILTNWMTTYNFVSKGENETVIKFGSPAPSDGSGRIDWRVKFIG